MDQSFVEPVELPSERQLLLGLKKDAQHALTATKTLNTARRMADIIQMGHDTAVEIEELKEHTTDEAYQKPLWREVIRQALTKTTIQSWIVSDADDFGLGKKRLRFDTINKLSAPSTDDDRLSRKYLEEDTPEFTRSALDRTGEFLAQTLGHYPEARVTGVGLRLLYLTSA